MGILGGEDGNFLGVFCFIPNAPKRSHEGKESRAGFFPVVFQPSRRSAADGGIELKVHLYL